MSLTVQLLPTSAGDTSQVQPLTSYLVNGVIALDAGSLGFALPSVELAKIEHILLTHSHLDHIASLPIAVDTAYPHLTHPFRVHAAAPTLEALHTHLFNDDVWIDFTEFNLAGTKTPCLAFTAFTPGKPFELNGLRFTPIPVNHPVPTVGFIVESFTAAVLFTSDTWRTDAIWAAASKVANLKAVIIECSFPDELAELAEGSGHLTPRLVAEETAKLGRRVPVYCVHIKPAMRQEILPQLAAYKDRGIEVMEIGKTYRW
jgi:cAMP phosphodiesterase